MTVSLQARLVAGRVLAIQVNPRPHVTHKFKVIKNLDLVDGYNVEGYTPAEWSKILDHWDSDNSTALQRAVVYIAGDVIEVDRFEAADLLTIVPGYFTPADELTQELADVLAKGDA